MYFDTHAHYDDPAFDDDRAEILGTLPECGVSLVINPGCDVPSSLRAHDIAQEYEYIFFAAGLHPEELKKAGENWLDSIADTAALDKCVAIGEIGLDYYWDDSYKAEQREAFIKQIELAVDIDKPIIVHDRDAHGDSFDLVRSYPEARGVFHCFSGSAEMAQELLKRGWYLGFDGPVTYKNARKALEVLEICPLDRILLETDSPYLAPVPFRGKRNSSANLSYICAAVAAAKKETPELIAEITLENGKRLFGIN